MPAPDSPEALIEQARHRTRRRRARGLAALLALAGLAAGVHGLLTGGPGVIEGTQDSPFANARAFSGQGELAFVSRDQLWVLDGAGGALRHLRVPAGYEAASPTFSRDGRWLAYVVQPTSANHYGPDQLWLAHGDGSGPHRVRGVRLDDLVGWSPRADLVAATVGWHSHGVPYGLPTAVDLVTPRGRVRLLYGAPSRPRSPGGVDAIGYTALWSPTGSAIALALEGGESSKIETIPVVRRGRPVVWLASRGPRPVPMSGVPGRVTGLIPQLAGWWAGWGIAFWVIDGGAVDSRDSTQLVALRRPGAEPRFIADTLSLGMSDEVAPGPAGKLALVATSNAAGRVFAAGKVVETCAPASGRCAAVPAATSWTGPQDRAGYEPCACRLAAPRSGAPGSGVSADPQWSPSGSLLAFEKAPVLESSAWPNDAWFADHAIYLWNSRTGRTRRVGKLNGSALPTWSANGRTLMYESGDGLWLTPVATGKPTEIAHPLYSQDAWNNKISHLASISYYGQIPWQSQFSWWSP